MADYSHLMGWVNNPKAVDLIASKMSNPYIGPISRSIRGSGDGKVQLLFKFVEACNGTYPTFNQAIGDCFTSDTKVLMSTGELKFIQDIEIGEYVITHKNRARKVLRTIEKNYSGELVTVQCKGYDKKITCTPDHQFVTYKNSVRKDEFGKRKKFDYTLRWKSIDSCDVKKDCLLLPFGLQNEEDRYETYNNKQILVDEKFARFIGLYLAEGGTDYGRVTFNLCIDEDHFANELISIGEELFGITGRKEYSKIKQNVLLVRFYSVVLEKFIKSIIPGNLYNKNVPLSILNSKKSVKIACLRGWIDGDGHNYKESNRVTGVSASSSLIDDLYVLSASCKLNPSLYLRNKEKHQTVASKSLDFYSTCANEIVSVNCVDKMGKKRCAKFTEFGIAREISEKKYHNEENVLVYCLEVEEDSSFIANGYAVHNCVSMGYAGSVLTLTATEILLRGEQEEWMGICSTEDIYGGSRVIIGKGQLGNEDGSLGAWAAEYVKSYGTLVRKKYDKYDLSVYSGERAKEWGRTGVPKELLVYAKEHTVKTVSMVKTYEELRDAVYNGYPVAICSNQGFNDQRDSEGFCKPQGEWGHCLFVSAVDDEYKRPGVLIQNSWGDYVKGPTRYEQPKGSFWVDADVVERKMLSAGDSWALSSFQGYPKRELNWNVAEEAKKLLKDKDWKEKR